VRELSTTVLIVGGTTGGVAAAISCLRLGVACVVAEQTDWLGGQLTAQGVPPDENSWIETVGGTATYQALRSAVRARTMARGAKARAVEPFGAFNPGGGWVSRCCAEPRDFAALLHGALLRSAAPGAHGPIPMIAGDESWVPGGGLDVSLLRAEFFLTPIGAVMSADGARVEGVEFRDGRTGDRVLIRARFVLDASDCGDVLALAGVEHSIGAEHQAVHNELHGRIDFDASRKIDPLDQQACSWCFALENLPGENHVVPVPDDYAFWREYSPGVVTAAAREPTMEPAWTGPLFSWTVPSHNPEGRRTFRMVPWPDTPGLGPGGTEELEMWRYRRIVDGSIWPARADGSPSADVSLINMVQMDYWIKPLLRPRMHGVDDSALAGARRQSLAFLHWMQTEAPRHDTRPTPGYPGLRLRGEELGTTDGFAKSPYIREPRRLVARTIVTEAHVGTDQRRAAGADRDASWSATPYGTAHPFADSVGIGHYAIDLHPSCAGRNNVYVPCAPFRVPLGSLIPVRVRNLIAAGKCLGVTHVTNGAYRMHHVEWNVGESAGALAAMCVGSDVEPAQVHEDAARTEDLQRLLASLGVRLSWPWE